MAAPKVGAIIDGYRFLGGDPNKQESWQPAGIDEIAAAKVAGTTEGKMQAKAAQPVNQNAFNEAANQLKDIRGARRSATGTLESIAGPFAANTGMIGAMEAGSDGIWKGIPGTPGYNLDKDLTTIRSRIMLSNLGKLQRNSPTGASGLGQLSNQEGEALRSTVAALNVGLPAGQLRQNLDRVREDVILNTPGVNISNPYDLSDGRSRNTIPRGAFYRDPQGNIRVNKNGDKGNPIVVLAQGAQAQPQQQNAFAPTAQQSQGGWSIRPVGP